jgi:hypothetical protein
MHEMSPAQSGRGILPGCSSKIQTLAAMPEVSQKASPTLLFKKQKENLRPTKKLRCQESG